MSAEYPLLVIVGPTAAGKSALALALASQLDGEIINCDSVQVYRGFDIGAGKVPPAERKGIPHHLLDLVEPGQIFTAGDYRREALLAMAGVRQRGKLPIIVGGTGLYLRALLLGLFEGPQRSGALRMRLHAMVKRRGRECVHRLLRRLDPGAATRIHPRDTQKIVRAAEVCLLTRQPISALHAQGRKGLHGFRVTKIGLAPDRRRLRERIDARVELMFAHGLVDETRAALGRLAAGPRPDLKPLDALGYRQACALLRGELSREAAIRQTQVATRQYAKRQMTWFRRETDITWFEGFGDDPEVQERILHWLRQRTPLSAAAPECTEPVKA